LSDEEKTVPQTEARPASNAWIGYVAPMVAFVALTWAEGQAGKSYIWVYIAKVIIVCALLFAFRKTWRDIRPDWRMVIPGVLVGLAVFAEWVLIDQAVPYPHLGTRSALDPFVGIQDAATRALFLGFRFFGLAVMVPVMEELFWRSFLIRYFTSPDWEKIPVGTFSWGAFAIVSALFGGIHPEWLAAVICGVAYGLLLRQTKSLFACVIAHGTTNLALGIYVLVTHNWKYW
jgi:CAAX prenyl protease-like protein